MSVSTFIVVSVLENIGLHGFCADFHLEKIILFSSLWSRFSSCRYNKRSSPVCATNWLHTIHSYYTLTIIPYKAWCDHVTDVSRDHFDHVTLSRDASVTWSQLFHIRNNPEHSAGRRWYNDVTWPHPIARNPIINMRAQSCHQIQSANLLAVHYRLAV